jgi:integrase/recombinase XerC
MADTDPQGTPEDRVSVSEFLDQLAHQRQASAHTISAYSRDLRKLLQFTGTQSLAQLQSAQIGRFVMQLHGGGLAPRSIARTLSSWRSYYRWLARRGVLAQNPCEGIRTPKQPRLLPKALTLEQMGALLDAPAETLSDLRDQAMFELFYSSGLRLSELASLDCNGGLDLREGEVRVTGKRAKTRIVPLGHKARTAIELWLARRGEMATGNEPALFVNPRGQRLSPRSIQRRLSSWTQKHGLAVHVTPHMLRHSFASHLLQSSGDLRAVQEMLGHANISTTQIYTHLDFQHLAKVYDSAHPRARRK